MFSKARIVLIAALCCVNIARADNVGEKNALVLMSDFGLSERFVASMKGVAISVDPTLQIHDLTHLVTPFDTWQASYILAGTINYWPVGTVFVSVVDPGVGTDRKSVVLKTASGHFVVTPDNGSLTLVAERQGVSALREIDESVNRLAGSEGSHTFHGRDVYSYTGARLAAGVIGFEGVGPLLEPKVLQTPYQKPVLDGDDTVLGNIVHVERPFGNIVTNIPQQLLRDIGLTTGNSRKVRIKITRAGEVVYSQLLSYVNTFGEVALGDAVLYSDSLQAIGLAVNNGDFSKEYGIGAGADWRVRLSRVD